MNTENVSVHNEDYERGRGYSDIHRTSDLRRGRETRKLPQALDRNNNPSCWKDKASMENYKAGSTTVSNNEEQRGGLAQDLQGPGCGVSPEQ